MTQPDALGAPPEAKASGPRYLIRAVRLAHCKRGPERCDLCRALDEERLCLLDLAPPRAGKEQRRVVYVEGPGGDAWREFEIVRVFDSEADAAQYALEHGIQRL
jgi:hypothetical protein